MSIQQHPPSITAQMMGQYDYLIARATKFMPELTAACEEAPLNASIPVNESHIRDLITLCHIALNGAAATDINAG